MRPFLIFLKFYDIIYIQNEKGNDSMTREKAIEASRAVDAIDGFQIFMEEVDRAIESAEELALLSVDFKVLLDTLMKTELTRLEQILADL